MNHAYKLTLLLFSIVTAVVYFNLDSEPALVTIPLTQDSNANNYIIKTELGDIVFEVYPKKAPLTVENFLKYVDMADFEEANFYRVVRMDNQPQDSIRIEVIQGNFTSNENSLGNIEHETTKETGILHEDGTISMARMDPGSASVAFFICINNQPQLDYGGKRNPDGQGFAAFGKVIKGMDVVKAIQLGDTNGQSLQNPVQIDEIVKSRQ
ncbi:peptidylprolyl isomerase [Pricia sp. S334]|uniref:peptidylprolyl isomerase n=1 Tax=Pricia mediterranea TaxID=3076079 RepID=A0ABU3L9U4_9FLAO|nr:peptidylprolyl isomerase [Pricia sp. S334]MDT7830437.1 peptidylprolyl isomerase [Pricia sp. S334]